MNIIFNLIALITFPVLGQLSDSNQVIYENETNKQESQTISSYSCDQRSYFRRISRKVTDYFNIECNTVYQGRNNYTAVGTLVDGEDVPLRVVHSCFALRDVNGSEVYSNLGVVMDGQCVGAIIYIYGLSKVTAGICDSRTGVTQVDVPKGNALFSIRGTCDSTCWGTVTTSYNPGKSVYIETGPTHNDSGYSLFEYDDYDFSNDPGVLNFKIKMSNPL